VERIEHDTGAGTATGMIVGILLVLLIAILALFFFFGGPARFAGTPSAPAPAGQTNVNVPQSAPQGQSGQSGPSINVPRQIDVNVNQPAQQAPSAPQAPTGNGQPAPAR
jgi:hypothetical protein